MLTVQARKLGSAAVLSLEGQMVTGETELLLHAVDSLSEKDALILDLTRVTVVDAHGLGVMLRLREQALEKGMQFELRNVSKPLSRVLEITHLDSVFHITSGLEFFPSVSRKQGPRTAAA